MIIVIIFAFLTGLLIGYIAGRFMQSTEVKNPGYVEFMKYGKYKLYMTTTSHAAYKKLTENDRLNLEATVLKNLNDDDVMKGRSEKLLIFFTFNNDSQTYSAKIDDMK
jgi:hypothetical protein